MNIYVLVAFVLTACATPEEKRFTLADALGGTAAISVPMRITEKGLIIVEDIDVDGRKLEMVLDTGATRSAIFETALNRLDLGLTAYRDTMVYGMVESGQHGIVDLQNVKIGSLEYPTWPIVVLDDRDTNFQKFDIYDGLIGMDIMADYQIYMSPIQNELRFIPNKTPVYVSYFWPRILLKQNPYELEDRSLHFMELRVDGRKTPAMLDTGAEFSAMNWPAASYAQTKPIRKRLRKEWELQGAVGTFEPIARVKLERVRGGQMFWDDKEFVIMDLESLDVLGIENQPFIIAGMNLFKDQAIFIDFERDFLSIVPNGDASQADPVTSQ